jgi:hypothetical protein
MTSVKLNLLAKYLLVGFLGGAPCLAAAQAIPTADRGAQASAFVLFSGTYTGLGASLFSPQPGSGGKNLTISAGADLDFMLGRRFALGAELRGSYPINAGKVDGQKTILGGVRATREPVGDYGLLRRFRPYGNFLVGRGQMDMQSGGYIVPGFRYDLTTSTVYSPGGGFEIELTPRVALKADAQFQRWSTPLTPSGTLWAKQGGIGLTYRFGASRYPYDSYKSPRR